MAEVLSISNLTVTGTANGRALVSGIDLSIGQGELVGLVGESGSGKTTIGLSCLGLQKAGTHRSNGDVSIAGRRLSLETPAGLVRLRREEVAYVPQSASAALNPALTIGRQMSDRLPKGTPDARQRLFTALEQVALPATAEFLGRYPFQLSGGQQQRVTIAAALLNAPRLIIFDEPTTGLDVAVQEQIVAMIRQIFEGGKTAGLFISHDLALVATLCSRTVVMRSGTVVEAGDTGQLFRAPGDAYVKTLVAAVPSLSRNLVALGAQKAQMPAGGATLTASGINAFHGSKQVLFDVDLQFPGGSCTAIVGESGSGKTTLCRTLIGLHQNYRGAVELAGAPLAKAVRQRSGQQRREMQYVFQSPFEALNPRLSVSEILSQPLNFFGVRPDARLINEQLDRVALAKGTRDKYPHQLSGGERQRVAIARALVLQPSVLICDEITSALDVSVQARVMELIAELRRERNMTVLFVTHNLALVPQIAEHVVVMQQGRVVDSGPTAAVFCTPASDFTRSLIERTPDIVDALGEKERVA